MIINTFDVSISACWRYHDPSAKLWTRLLKIPANSNKIVLRKCSNVNESYENIDKVFQFYQQIQYRSSNSNVWLWMKISVKYVSFRWRNLKL